MNHSMMKLCVVLIMGVVTSALASFGAGDYKADLANRLARKIVQPIMSERGKDIQFVEGSGALYEHFDLCKSQLTTVAEYIADAVSQDDIDEGVSCMTTPILKGEGTFSVGMDVLERGGNIENCVVISVPLLVSEGKCSVAPSAYVGIVNAIRDHKSYYTSQL